MHESSFERMSLFVEKFLAESRGEPLRILDVGSLDVNGSYRDLFDDAKWTYTGLDLDEGPNVHVVTRTPYAWKAIPRNSVDVVISGQALEHIEFPWVTLLEIRRVLRPGGISCLIVPSTGPEHRFPLDCWRFFGDGLRALAHWADLRVVSLDVDMSDSSWSWESAQWHDAVLIAEKPARERALSTIKQEILRRVVQFQADRRSCLASPSRG